jgi:DNA-binding NarL/FixJ family response regulator
VDLLAGTPALLEAARARLTLGSSPEVPDAEAVPLLDSALGAARACGARGVAADAARALAHRGRPASSPDDAPARLTSRQRRVAELTAAGLDVNQVAQRLFLTPGTVRAVLESTTGAAP